MFGLVDGGHKWAQKVKEEQVTYCNLEETTFLAYLNLLMAVFGLEPTAILALMVFAPTMHPAAQQETALTTKIILAWFVANQESLQSLLLNLQ